MGDCVEISVAKSLQMFTIREKDISSEMSTCIAKCANPWIPGNIKYDWELPNLRPISSHI